MGSRVRERRPRVQLIVSGDLEEHLPATLARLFPGADFPPAERAHAFTTTRIAGAPALPEGADPCTLKGYEMVSRMLAAIDPGARGEPADFAVAIDDVEVDNRGNEEAIVAHLRVLLEHLIARGPRDRRGAPLSTVRPDEPDVGLVRPLKTPQRRRDALRERCSFHLLAPMAEAPFFGDFASVRRACPGRTAREPAFDPADRDFEVFETADPAYLAPADDWRPSGGAFPARWARPNRRFHPKHYLEFLLDPGGVSRRPYREKHDGKAILEQLDLGVVLGPADHGSLLRAMMDDIADMCGLPRPAWAGGAVHPLTQRRRQGLLRNVA